MAKGTESSKRIKKKKNVNSKADVSKKGKKGDSSSRQRKKKPTSKKDKATTSVKVKKVSRSASVANPNTTVANTTVAETTQDPTDPEVPFVKDPDRKEPPTLTNPTDTQKEQFLAFAQNVCTLGVQGLLNEWTVNVKPYIPQFYGRTTFDANSDKNRYKDVVCNDLSRVILNDGRGNDYIHANYVRGDPLFNEFICTQGPMPNTVIDFWRMIVITKAQNIAMLCEVKELGKVKCEQYWPPNRGEKLTFGDFTIENANIRSTTPTSSNAWIVKSHLIVSWTTNGGGKHHVMHHHWKNWPDRSAPRSGRGVLRILRDVRVSPYPTVVHCSAGIGRTGTLVAIEMCLLRLVNTGKLSLVDICKRLRDQRMSTIQVDLQYAYLAYVVLEYGKALGFLADTDELKRFKESLDTLLPPDTGFDPAPDTVDRKKSASRSPRAQ